MQPHPKILLVDDDPSHIEIILRSLDLSSQQFHIVTSHSLLEAEQLLKQHEPDLVLIDWNLPDGKGVDLLKMHTSGPFPAIIITSQGNEEIAVEVMKSGAIDYIVKSAENFADMPHIIERSLREWQRIQKLHEVQTELESSERLVRSILKSIPDIVYRLDQEGRIVYVSDSVSHYGYNPAELIGKNIFEYVHPEDVDKAKFLLNERRTGDRSIKGFEVRLFSKQKQTHLFEVQSSIIDKDIYFSVDAEGLYDNTYPSKENYVGTQGIARDITEKRKAEKLLKLRLKFETLISEISTALINLPTNEIDHYINLSLEKIGKFMQCDRVFVNLIDHQNNRLDQTYHWDPENILSTISNPTILHDQLKWSQFQIQQLDFLSIMSLDHLPKEAASDYEMYRSRYIKSMIAVPMRFQKSILGYLGCIMNHIERRWQDFDISSLQFLSQVITNALQRKKIETIIMNLATGVTSDVEDNFFQNIVNQLSNGLEADYAFISEIPDDDQEISRTLAVSHKGKPVDAIQYELKDTPCQNVIHQNTCIYPQKVQSLFPYDLLLQNMGIEAYIGTPLTGSTGQVVGLMVLLFRRPLASTQLEESVLQIYATRVSEELLRLRMLNELERKEQIYRKTIEAAGGVVYFQNYNKNKYEFMSSGIESLLGYQQGIMTPDFFTLIQQQCIVMGKLAEYPIETAVQTAKETGELWRADYEVITSSGGTKWLANSAIQVMDDQNNVIGSMGVLQDITENKLFEEMLKQLNDSLEHRVEERTQQLLLANKELESFSYSVSHDLRAPLQAIDGFSQIIMEDYQERLDDAGKNYLSRIQSCTRRMEQMINALLMLSRVIRAEINIVPVNLSELVHQQLLEFQVANRDRQMEIHVAPNLTAQGDSHLLGQVIQNLLSNAWKFTQKTSYPRIEVGMISNQNSPIYFVKDNGSGFDMKYADKLFGAFQRLHSADEFEGYGIGLATVKKIIEKHNGAIWVESEINKGTTFYFTINCSDASFRL